MQKRKKKDQGKKKKQNDVVAQGEVVETATRKAKILAKKEKEGKNTLPLALPPSLPPMACSAPSSLLSSSER